MTRDDRTNTVGESPPTDPAALERRLVSRRALVRAGWVVPVVLGLGLLPGEAFASPGAGACVDVWVDENGVEHCVET